MQEKIFYVYGFIRSKDSERGPKGSLYYIGKGKDYRMFSPCRRVSRPVLVRNIVVIADKLYEKDALQLEMLLIHQFGRIDQGTGILHNLTDGGEGCTGYEMPIEVRLKHRHTMLGRKFSEEHRRKLSERKRGRTIPPEQRVKISQSMKGRTFTDEHREKLKVSCSKRRLTPEQKMAISLRQLGSVRGPMSEEQKEKISASNKLAWKKRKAKLLLQYKNPAHLAGFSLYI